jgi:DNA-directed RNA polymerase specialized sigma24 family protein
VPRWLRRNRSLQQKAVELRINGKRRLSVVEAAALCGISESAIKINVHRGLKELSAVISQEKTK